MGIIGEMMDIDFVASTGDNFYDNGLTGVDDPAFDESFSKIYTAPSLQKQWYNVLGNHDYREIVDILFVDTNPFVDEYFTKPGGYNYDWRAVLPREKYLSNLLKDVDSALKESRAKWKIVVGHHTIKTAGIHGNTEELVKQLLPILEENNVDLYINGHDHCLEHISTADSPIQFLTSGGGSKAWRGVMKWPANPDEVKFYYDGQGFMSVKITPAQVDVAFYDVSGSVLHTWSRTKEIFSIV
ncbi:purple acid phosphatase 3 isoform X2 [Eucalyptus grandis]|uniref:purple acid phosphatase 3 isoform X2 n=1 Tax=Eucalyptus grandis TaxID=71139 RepID=UPI00192E9F28|nr:purple acid phosphatase 3 isoform X2 [Eucalyptus grandis]